MRCARSSPASITYFHSYLSYCPVGAGGRPLETCRCCPALPLLQPAPPLAAPPLAAALYEQPHPPHHPPLVPLHHLPAAALCELHAPKAAHFLAPSMVSPNHTLSSTLCFQIVNGCGCHHCLFGFGSRSPANCSMASREVGAVARLRPRFGRLVSNRA